MQLYKSTILTHQWWFQNWSVFWLNVVSNLDEAISSLEAWLLIQTTQFLLKPLKMASWILGKKWFLTWYQSSKNWTGAWKDEYADPASSNHWWTRPCHMAHMDIHYGYSVNGVAALHTEILKNSELKPLRHLPRKIQQQNKRYHIPSLAHARQPKTISLLGWDYWRRLAPWSRWAWKTSWSYWRQSKCQRKIGKHQGSQQT